MGNTDKRKGGPVKDTARFCQHIPPADLEDLDEALGFRKHRNTEMLVGAKPDNISDPAPPQLDTSTSRR